MDDQARPDAWWTRAACKGTEDYLWFWEPGDECVPGRRNDALAICNELCTVREQCLEAAMFEERVGGYHVRHGIRGGMLPVDRVKLARQIRAESRRFPRAESDCGC